MELGTTLREAVIYFQSYDNCHKFMVELRWPDGVVRCPRCNSGHVIYLEKARVWKCYAKHDSPKFSLKPALFSRIALSGSINGSPLFG
jgi:Transposase zinc-ribbon domain